MRCTLRRMVTDKAALLDVCGLTSGEASTADSGEPPSIGTGMALTTTCASAMLQYAETGG